MSEIYDVISSSSFRNTMHSLSVICLILAVVVAVVALAFYGRARETDDVADEKKRWVLLLATWRDSFIITLLYTSESIAFRFGDFSALSEVTADRVFLYAPIVQPVFSLIAEILMFAVATMRVIAISQWLSEQRSHSQ